MDSIQVLKSEIQAPTENKKKVNSKDSKLQENKSKVENMQVKGRIESFYSGVKKQCCAFFEEAKVYEKLEKIATYLEVTPLLTWGIFAVLVGISTPIVLFVLFAVVNIAFVVAGFIIVEVTIFIIGATVLSCSVFFVITTAAMIGLCLLSFYLIFCYLIILLKKFKV